MKPTPMRRCFIQRPMAAQEQRHLNCLSAKLPRDSITKSLGLAVSDAKPAESRYIIPTTDNRYSSD